MQRDEWLETLRKRGWSDSDISKARFAWNACERGVREECAEIVKSIGDIEPASYVAEKILETIK